MMSQQVFDEIIAASAGGGTQLSPAALGELSAVTGIPLDKVTAQHDAAYQTALDDYGVSPGPVIG